MSDKSSESETVKVTDLLDQPFNPTQTLGPHVYTPDRDRERVRGWIALSLLALLIIIVAVVLVGIMTPWLPIEYLEKIGAVILSPVVALLGAVMGFYFGERSRDRNG